MRLALAQDGAHAGDLLGLVVVVVQVAPVVIALRLLCVWGRKQGEKGEKEIRN